MLPSELEGSDRGESREASLGAPRQFPFAHYIGSFGSFAKLGAAPGGGKSGAWRTEVVAGAAVGVGVAAIGVAAVAVAAAAAAAAVFAGRTRGRGEAVTVDMQPLLGGAVEPGGGAGIRKQRDDVIV
jgi:hypothetical protein